MQPRTCKVSRQIQLELVDPARPVLVWLTFNENVTTDSNADTNVALLLNETYGTHAPQHVSHGTIVRAVICANNEDWGVVGEFTIHVGDVSGVSGDKNKESTSQHVVTYSVVPKPVSNSLSQPVRASMRLVNQYAWPSQDLEFDAPGFESQSAFRDKVQNLKLTRDELEDFLNVLSASNIPLWSDVSVSAVRRYAYAAPPLLDGDKVVAVRFRPYMFGLYFQGPPGSQHAVHRWWDEWPDPALPDQRMKISLRLGTSHKDASEFETAYDHALTVSNYSDWNWSAPYVTTLTVNATATLDEDIVLYPESVGLGTTTQPHGWTFRMKDVYASHHLLAVHYELLMVGGSKNARMYKSVLVDSAYLTETSDDNVVGYGGPSRSSENIASAYAPLTARMSVAPALKFDVVPESPTTADVVRAANLPRGGFAQQPTTASAPSTDAAGSVSQASVFDPINGSSEWAGPLYGALACVMLYSGRAGYRRWAQHRAESKSKAKAKDTDSDSDGYSESIEFARLNTLDAFFSDSSKHANHTTHTNHGDQNPLWDGGDFFETNQARESHVSISSEIEPARGSSSKGFVSSSSKSKLNPLLT